MILFLSWLRKAWCAPFDCGGMRVKVSCRSCNCCATVYQHTICCTNWYNHNTLSLVSCYPQFVFSKRLASVITRIAKPRPNQVQSCAYASETELTKHGSNTRTRAGLPSIVMSLGIRCAQRPCCTDVPRLSKALTLYFSEEPVYQQS